MFSYFLFFFKLYYIILKNDGAEATVTTTTTTTSSPAVGDGDGIVTVVELCFCCCRCRPVTPVARGTDVRRGRTTWAGPPSALRWSCRRHRPSSWSRTRRNRWTSRPRNRSRPFLACASSCRTGRNRRWTNRRGIRWRPSRAGAWPPIFAPAPVGAVWCRRHRRRCSGTGAATS